MSLRDRIRKSRAIRGTILILLVTLAVVGTAAWYARQSPDSESLFQQAQAARNSQARIALLQQSIRAGQGSYPPAEVELGLAFARSKNWDQVAPIVANLNYQDCPPGGLATLARLCLDGQQWKSAETILAQLPRDAITDEDRLLLYCHLYQGTDQTQALIETVERLTRTAPNNSRYWLMLAEIHERLKNVSALVRVYQSALSHGLPKSEESEIRHRLLEHTIEVGDAAEARRQLDAWRAEGERNPRLDFYDAYICQLEGDAELALERLQIVIRQVGEVPEAVRIRGVLQLELGHLDQAAADLKRATELRPADSVAHFKLAEVYRRLGQRGDAERYRRLAQESQDRYLQLRKKFSRPGE